jgi:hypothetical protein
MYNDDQSTVWFLASASFNATVFEIRCWASGALESPPTP